MKKLLFLLFAVLLTTCSGNDTFENTSVDDGSIKYPVRFSVSNFNSDIQDLRSLNLNDSNLKAFMLLIANKDSVYVEVIHKTNLTDLSSLKDMEIQLPQGKYTAYSIVLDNWDAEASIESDTEKYGYLGKRMDFMLDGNHYGKFLAGTKMLQEYTYTYNGMTRTIPLNNISTQQYDYFYKKTDFTVDQNGATVNQILPRITGKLEFHFTDIKPLDNSVYSEDMYYAYIYLNVYSGIDFRNGYSVPGPGFYITRKQWSDLANKPLSFYTRPTGNGDYRLSIRIINPLFPDATSGHEYIIPNIKVFENKKTIMTGPLNKPSGFSVDINNNWSEDINVEF